MRDKLYIHQKELIEENPKSVGVAFGCGMGKTRTVVHLADGKGRVLVVAPKTTVETKTWETELERVGVTLPITVTSKERFKKGAPAAEVLVLDEAHVFLGVRADTRYRNKVEVPRASDLFEQVVRWVRNNNPRHIYMASATPIPTPMAVWAASEVFGCGWDYFAFRRRFYTFLPHIRRGVWVPKSDAKSEADLMELARGFWRFKKREDAGDVPALVFKDVRAGLSTSQKSHIRGMKLLYPEPMARVAKLHQAEQGGYDGEELDEYKTAEVAELAREFPKLLVFARYTAQIDRMAEKLKKTFKGRDILVLDSRTKDRKALLDRAEKAGKETIVIAQSQVSSSYNLPSFRCVCFASASYSFVDYEQALGRNQRSEGWVPSVYVHLVAGDVDAAVFEALRHKKDFSEELFANKLL